MVVIEPNNRIRIKPKVLPKALKKIDTLIGSEVMRLGDVVLYETVSWMCPKTY